MLDYSMIKTKVITDWEGTPFHCRPHTDDEFFVVHEKDYYKFIKLNRNDVWLDIGAHIGTFTLRIANQVSFVYSYEPDLVNYTLFLKNGIERGITNVESFNMAVVGNDDKTRSFYLNRRKGTGSHGFYRHNRPRVTVQCANINTILREHPEINCIKMDCEGAEVELLASLNPNHNLKQIIFEYHRSIHSFSKGNYWNDDLLFRIVDGLKKRFAVVTSNKDLNNLRHNWGVLIYASNIGELI